MFNILFNYFDISDCSEARCDMGLCIPSAVVCDGKCDCPDQSDEGYCVQTSEY